MIYRFVLLHGWGGSADSLKNLKDLIEEKKHSVLNLDLPCRNSDQLNEPMNLEDYCDWVVNTVKNRFDEKTIFLGHSFGGKLLIALAIKGYIKNKIILINSSGVKPKNNFKKFFWKRISIIFKKISNNTLRKIVYKFLIRERDYLKIENVNLKKTFVNVTSLDFNDDFDKIKNKCLILWGLKDTVTPVWMGKYLKENITNSELKVYNSRHNLPIVHPELIIEDIIQFSNC